MLIINSFSLNMVTGFPATIGAHEITADMVRKLCHDNIVSAVGHADTARIYSNELGFDVPVNRTTISLTTGDTAIVGQYRGPRLAEGATVLPEGATIQWLFLEVG